MSSKDRAVVNAMRLACEWGFRSAEKGRNLEATMIEFDKLEDGGGITRASMESPIARALDRALGPKRCTLCQCDATSEKFGFPVCVYHHEHGEDDRPCPRCNHPIPAWLLR